MNFKILYCEDDSRERETVKLILSKKLEILSDLHITIESEDFDNTFTKIKTPYDLLILDLHNNESNKPHKDLGVDILIQNEAQLKIPIIVYSSKNNEVQFFEDENKKKYSSFLTLLPKKTNSYDNLIEYVKGFIINKIPIEKYYKLYNENDVYLRLNIERIGFENFNFVIYSIFEKYKKKILVKPMPSGWSGAVLFYLSIGSDNFVLKLSKNMDSLKDEHQKSIQYYNLFPDQLITSIRQDEYYSFDNSVFGFLIKNLENAKTFLSYILELISESDINKILNEIYISNNSLSMHYLNRIDNDQKKDWTSIFEKINEGKIQLIRQSYSNLKPIIVKFYQEIEIDNFESICIEGKYINLNKTKLLGDEFNKYPVLSHGDFHAGNILIQGERPFIIDTGALGYQHWALDITRLIVSIFILGLDKDKLEYFDLGKIKYYKEIGEKITYIDPITIAETDQNKNCLVAINWLLDNLEKIYKTQFSLFEYQLGLMKEFLQISYRTETVPPNKRALALILADICLEKANENVDKPAENNV